MPPDEELSRFARTGNLTPAQRRQICKLALAGWCEYEIVRELGFEKGHVHRPLTALRQEQGQRNQRGG